MRTSNKIKKKRDKYSLYEEAVQTPEQHTDMFALIYSDLRGRAAHILREDFCGTFMICCEWVKRDDGNTALGLDFDAEPLRYGERRHLSKLSPHQKKRVAVLQKNVLTVTRPKADIVAACNFSFFVFKEKSLLVRYFRLVLRSLRPGGVAIFELSGGAGMMEKTKERRTVKSPKTGKFTYVWDQKTFDPITHDCTYSIHFKFPDGSSLDNVFTYDWRLWSIPEVRDALSEAGFRQTHVYWEVERRGVGTGQYARMEHAPNDYAWIAYVVGAI